MIDFEPPHMQTFFAYLRAGWLLSLCLCGIDMCMSDRRDSEFVREAVTRLETLISNPKESEEVILILEDYMPRSELLDFLKNTLNALKGDAIFRRNNTKQFTNVCYNSWTQSDKDTEALRGRSYPDIGPSFQCLFLFQHLGSSR